MSIENIRAWLRLSRLELSPKAAGTLIERFGSPEAVFGASEAELRQVEGLTDRARSKVLAPEPAAVERDLGLLEQLGVSILPITDVSYPSRLKQIYDPPTLLYVKGAILENDSLGVAIVGSRRANNYGRSLAGKIAGDLAARGLTIISGGARGVDTAAHKGALAAGGRTIVVLGCGVDVNYPAENKALFTAVSESGAVISEFPLGSTPEPWRFPPRNRLISGMSLGVLVCQSPEASGALITASYAAEQGRDVYAVPGNVDDDRNSGCHKLIKDGAKLVESALDVFQELGIDAGDETSVKQLALPMENLTEAERQIIAMLSLDPVQMDEIINACALPAPMVSGTLTILEMKNFVKRVPGNAFVRVV